MSKLKSCPFCGTEVQHLEHDDMKKHDWVDYHSVYCFDCETGFWENTKDKAIRRWNTRPDPLEAVRAEIVKTIADLKYSGYSPEIQAAVGKEFRKIIDTATQHCEGIDD